MRVSGFWVWGLRVFGFRVLWLLGFRVLGFRAQAVMLPRPWFCPRTQQVLLTRPARDTREPCALRPSARPAAVRSRTAGPCQLLTLVLCS